MEYIHKYKILPELHLNIQVYTGNVTLQTLFESMNKLIDDPEYSETNNGIVDFRNAELIFQDKELESFIEYLIQQNITKSPRRVGLITQTPNQVVFTSLFTRLAKNTIVIDYQVFSTFKAAADFLDIPFSKRDIVDSTLKSLKT